MKLLQALSLLGVSLLGWGSLRDGAFVPVRAQTLTSPVAGQPLMVHADHPEAERKITTGYQLYVSGVKTGAEIATATAWDPTLNAVVMHHPGLAAGSYDTAVEAVRRVDGEILRSRSVSLSFSVGPGTEPPPGGDIPKPLPPASLYIRWSTDPLPPDDSSEGELVQRVVGPVSSELTSTVTLPIGIVVAGQAVVVGISQPGSGARKYSVKDNLGRDWVRVGLAKMGTAEGNTRGSQLWTVPPTKVAETSLTVVISVDSTTAVYSASAVVIDMGSVDPTGQVTVDPDNILAHSCGPDPWPMEQSGLVLCLTTLTGNAVVTPARGVSLLPGGSSTFAWMANEVEEEDSAYIPFTTSVARRAATVGVRVR